MPRKVMFNYLELAYSPVSNYVFSLIKEDPEFQHATQQSSLYIIAQRGELTFELLTLNPADDHQLLCVFQIKQKGNNSVLDCIVPLYQPNLASDMTRDLKFHIEYALPKPDPMPMGFPQNRITNLLFTYHDGTFVGWLSPENFIQNYLNGAIEATVDGPIDNFITYKVHYVGKATEQNVYQRLTGHSTLQNILSLEYPLHYGTLPTHEIAILFLRFREAVKLHTISSTDEITDDIIDSVMGRNNPTLRTISLDAEKALIKAMQPKYNKEFYKNYPKSKDGLYPWNLDAYSFMIHSYIILEYQNGRIKGVPDIGTADEIVVERRRPLRVINKQY